MVMTGWASQEQLLKVTITVGDVTEEKVLKTFIENTISNFGRIDTLVRNNHGLRRFR